MTLMVPNGMTFAVGSSNLAGGESSTGKTLDEMIKDRRKTQVSSKRAPKKTSTSDRSIATGRAKREAATKARRGIREEKKPSAMEIEREVYRQTRNTAAAKKKSQKKASGGRLAPDSALRSKKKKSPKEQPAPVAVFGGQVPPKKAVEAAVKGMEAAGFKIPTGYQVVMTFIPVAAEEKTVKKNTKNKSSGGPKNNNIKKKGDGRRKKK